MGRHIGVKIDRSTRSSEILLLGVDCHSIERMVLQSQIGGGVSGPKSLRLSIRNSESLRLTYFCCITLTKSQQSNVVTEIWEVFMHKHLAYSDRSPGLLDGQWRTLILHQFTWLSPRCSSCYGGQAWWRMRMRATKPHRQRGNEQLSLQIDFQSEGGNQIRKNIDKQWEHIFGFTFYGPAFKWKI